MHVVKPVLPLLLAALVGLGLAFHIELAEDRDPAEFPGSAVSLQHQEEEWSAGPALLEGFDPIPPASLARPEPSGQAPRLASRGQARAEKRRPAPGSDEVEDAIRDLTSSESSPAELTRAVDVLGTSNDPAAARALLAGFAAGTDEDLREEILLRLETRDDVAAEEILAISSTVGPGPVAERLAELVARRLADPAAVVSAAGSSANAGFVDQVLRRLDPASRVAGAEGALARGGEEARREALALLAGVSDPAARAVLESLLLDEPEPALRVEALETLLDLGSGAEADVLRHLVATDPAAEVRSAAASMLADAGSAEDLGILETALGADPDASVRAAAADALASASGDAEHALLSSLKSDPSDEVRAHAGRALAARYVLAGAGVEAYEIGPIEEQLRVLAETGAEDARGVAAAGIELLTRVREAS